MKLLHRVQNIQKITNEKKLQLDLTDQYFQIKVHQNLMQSQLYAARMELKAAGNTELIKEYDAFVNEKIAANF